MKTHKPLTRVIDDQVKKGGTWKKILANINRVASRRDMADTYRKSSIKRHVQSRVKKDPNYYGGKILMSAEKVVIDESEQPSDFSTALQVEERLEKSNKDIVYLAWKDGEDDIDKLHRLVDEQVKKSTIYNWISSWKHDKNMPAITKQPN